MVIFLPRWVVGGLVVVWLLNVSRMLAFILVGVWTRARAGVTMNHAVGAVAQEGRDLILSQARPTLVLVWKIPTGLWP